MFSSNSGTKLTSMILSVCESQKKKTTVAKIAFFHKIRGKEAFFKAIYSTEHKFCTKMDCDDVFGKYIPKNQNGTQKS